MIIVSSSFLKLKSWSKLMLTSCYLELKTLLELTEEERCVWPRLNKLGVVKERDYRIMIIQ